MAPRKTEIVQSRVIDDEEDRELAKVQLNQADDEAKSDVVDGEVVSEDGKKYDYIELKGQKFRLREKVGAMAMFSTG